jgi:hypothetical protein
VTRIGELGTTLDATSNWRTLRRNTKYAIWHNIPEYTILYNFTSTHVLQNRANIVDTATGYTSDNPGVRVWVPVGAIFFPSPCHPDQIWGTLSLLPNVYLQLFPQGKIGWAVNLDNSPPTSAEAKKTWICISTTPYVFIT